jgi:hypothetical protein
MKNTFTFKFFSLLLAVAMLAGCSSTTIAKDWNGVGSPDGQVLGHVSTSNVALHLLFNKPLTGNATIPATVSDFTAAAKQAGATKVRIVQSSRTNYWWVFFPFTIVLTPVTSNVAGDAIA